MSEFFSEDDLYAVPISVSMYDIACDPVGNKAIKEDDTELLKQYLDKKGFDLVFGYEITSSVYHRCDNLPPNESWYGPRVVGIEKRTKEWLNSKEASEEAIIGYCRDPHLRSELIVLSRQANHTGNLIDDMKKQSKYNEWKEEK